MEECSRTTHHEDETNTVEDDVENEPPRTTLAARAALECGALDDAHREADEPRDGHGDDVQDFHPVQRGNRRHPSREVQFDVPTWVGRRERGEGS